MIFLKESATDPHLKEGTDDLFHELNCLGGDGEGVRVLELGGVTCGKESGLGDEGGRL